MDLFKKNFLDEAAELFDLPPDLVAGLPHIEVVGNTHFYMERHKGILSYSGEEIDINGEKTIVRVYGENLELMSPAQTFSCVQLLPCSADGHLAASARRFCSVS